MAIPATKAHRLTGRPSRVLRATVSDSPSPTSSRPMTDQLATTASVSTRAMVSHALLMGEVVPGSEQNTFQPDPGRPSSSAFDCPARGHRLRGGPAGRRTRSTRDPASAHLDSAPTRKMGQHSQGRKVPISSAIMGVRIRRAVALAGGIVTGIAGGFALADMPAFSRSLNGSMSAAEIGFFAGLDLGLMAAAIVRNDSS
jgi:hypothetical protein